MGFFYGGIGVWGLGWDFSMWWCMVFLVVPSKGYSYGSSGEVRVEV